MMQLSQKVQIETEPPLQYGPCLQALPVAITRWSVAGSSLPSVSRLFSSLRITMSAALPIA